MALVLHILDSKCWQSRFILQVHIDLITLTEYFFFSCFLHDIVSPFEAGVTFSLCALNNISESQLYTWSRRNQYCFVQRFVFAGTALVKSFWLGYSRSSLVFKAVHIHDPEQPPAVMNCLLRLVLHHLQWKQSSLIFAYGYLNCLLCQESHLWNDLTKQLCLTKTNKNSWDVIQNELFR